MSFEVDYNPDGTPASVRMPEQQPEVPLHRQNAEKYEKAPILGAPQEESVVEEEATVEAAPEEAQEENTEEVAEEEETPEPSKKEVKSSWSDLREAKFQAEKRAQQLEQELLNVKRTLQKSAPKAKETLTLEEDALVEGRHLSAVERKLQAMEEKLAEYEQEGSNSRIERALKQEYADFDSVVSSQNLEKLEQDYPEIHQTLFAGDDLHAKGKSAYIMLKKLGIAKDFKTNSAVADRVQALKNSVKPKPLASVSQQSKSPLSQVHNLTQDTEITDELQEQLMRLNEQAMRSRR